MAFGMFKKLRKATPSFVMTVHQSVHKEQLSSCWTNYREH